MTTQVIFKKYFKKKFIFWGVFGIVVVGIRYFRGFNTSALFALGFILFTLIVAFIIGLIEYYFYEKSSPKIVRTLLAKPPLIDFLKSGFNIQEDNKMEGQINNFKVILAPLTNIQRDNWLTILIPLQLKEGLEKYFKGLDDNFKLAITGKALFAQSVLKNYDKKYNYDKLYALLNEATKNLQAKKIEPLKIIQGDTTVE